MAKRLTEKQKSEIIESFSFGKTIDELSQKFSCSKLTISRNLKKSLGEKKFKQIFENNKLTDNNKDYEKRNKKSVTPFDNDLDINREKSFFKNENNENPTTEFLPISEFTEITPLTFDIENAVQKDLSSIPLSDVDFPKVVYMIVDKTIELEVKNLKEYPEWQFLSNEELKRKTIEVFDDLQIAKRNCSKEKKVIKVPNTKVFKIVTPFLLKRGISRIVNANKLIAL